jgi:hypothetical protein
MARHRGRALNMRIRLMRFALWAQHCKRPPTAQEIADMLDISLSTAREWRTDWFTAISPMDIENVPAVLTLQNLSANPAATGQASPQFQVGKI